MAIYDKGIAVTQSIEQLEKVSMMSYSVCVFVIMCICVCVCVYMYNVLPCVAYEVYAHIFT